MHKSTKYAGSFVLVLLAVLMLALPGLGMDLWAPPWDPSLPSQTYEAWEASQTSGVTDVKPTASENPYGAPMATFENSEMQWIPGPDGVDTWTWHIGAGGGVVSIWVPNNPDPQFHKLIFWQMTSDKSATPTGNPPTTSPASTSLPTPYPQIDHGTGGWYTYNGLLEIRPNPEGEWIYFDLVESTNIEEIVIKTICEPVPEPSSLLALLGGVAGLGHVFLRRRR